MSLHQSAGTGPTKASNGEMLEVLDQWITEFLRYHQYRKTIEAYEQEKVDRLYESKSTFKMQPISAEKLQQLKSSSLEAFDYGDQNALFANLDDYMPAFARRSFPDYVELELLLHIYFSVYPILLARQKRRSVDAAELQRRTGTLKSYLETVGQELSQHPKYLEYYALPYVRKPESHPSFMHLFQQSWATSVRQKLHQFLESGHDMAAKKPSLHQLYAVWKEKRGGVPEPAAPEPEPDTNPLLQNAVRDLFSMCVSAYHGAGVSGSTLTDIKDRLDSQYRELGLPDIGVLDPRSPNVRPPVAPVPDEQQMCPLSVVPEASMSLYQSAQLPALNYSVIWQVLGTQKPVVRALLLQALRWRLTKVGSASSRTGVVRAYVDGDILQWYANAPDGATVMWKCLHDSNEVVQEQFARFVNVLASEPAGRRYLLSRDSIVALLMEVLRSQENDTLFRQNLLCALQKLSLRRKAQTTMVAEGMVRWLIGMLRNHQDLSDCSLEYGTALLMNLCLRSKGKDACEELEDELSVLNVLSNLLEHENFQVRTYINGVLYSIFSRRAMREKARAMGMEDMLSYLVQNSEEELAKQVEYILEQLAIEASDDDDGSRSVDGDDADADEEEEEDPAGDDEEDGDTEFFEDTDESFGVLEMDGLRMDRGEGLLGPYYRARETPAASPDKSYAAASPVQPKSDTPISQRPVTPKRGPGASSQPIRAPDVEEASSPMMSGEASPSAARRHPIPSDGALQKARDRTGVNDEKELLSEYENAFVSRSRVARTPHHTQEGEL